MEIWKDIKGYEGIYKVSNFGRVKGLNRKSWMKINNCYRNIKEKILKQTIGGNGYFTVTLCNKGSRKTHTVHSLVWYGFNEYQKIKHIDHIDNSKTNNNLKNLQLLSVRENVSKVLILKNTSSKFTGVSYRKDLNKWSCFVWVKGKNKHLGYFDKELDASNAYKEFIKDKLL